MEYLAGVELVLGDDAAAPQAVVAGEVLLGPVEADLGELDLALQERLERGERLSFTARKYLIEAKK